MDGYGSRRWFRYSTVLLLAIGLNAGRASAEPSIARVWDDQILNAIRRDLARPVVHSRNLFHFSIAVWDGWAVYNPAVSNYIAREKVVSSDVAAARTETISYAAYRVLRARYADSPGKVTTLAALDAQMDTLGYDKAYSSVIGQTPAAVGNRIAALVLAMGLYDGANEIEGYKYPAGSYTPVNAPLTVVLPGDPTLTDPNRWQPLALAFMVDQNGNILPDKVQTFLGPHWGNVKNFSLPPLRAGDRTWLDPGPPPLLGGEGDDLYKINNVEVIRLSSQLTPDDGVMMDVSPASMGNSFLGTNSGTGYALNPVTGQPYTPQLVKRGDYGRCIAELWADGPDSELPPGHWNTVANYVSDHPLVEKRFMGQGPILDDLEWDVKMYLALNGALHDAGIACWSAKGVYDFVRPICSIRYMCSKGQSSDPGGPAYDPQGIPLVPDLIEFITPESSAAGQRHEHLAEFVGEIAIRSWRGNPANPETQYSGTGWIRAALWVPYQRSTFVTPPFAAYTSGHSTFSRAGAEVLTKMTGSPWFPGGLGELAIPQDTFLAFEIGPTAAFHLEWASYYDAADEAANSRIWGGIHVRSDDFPARRMGSEIGIGAFAQARKYFDGQVSFPTPTPTPQPTLTALDVNKYLLGKNTNPNGLDANSDATVDIGDSISVLSN